MPAGGRFALASATAREKVPGDFSYQIDSERWERGLDTPSLVVSKEKRKSLLGWWPGYFSFLGGNFGVLWGLLFELF